MSEIKERNGFNEDQSSFNLGYSKSPQSQKAEAASVKQVSEASYRFQMEKVAMDKSPSIIADKGDNDIHETPKLAPSPFKAFATPGPEMNPQNSTPGT